MQNKKKIPTKSKAVYEQWYGRGNGRFIVLDHAILQEGFNSGDEPIIMWEVKNANI